ncbi:intracellular signaling protein [Idiomarina piscisalsi]|uniref:histidine kinase n=2 Tax=Idiomarina piscisalsi TaxID=1096243 RepID=A0ABM6LQL8_9GAMM|nr:intracellular signaling protein [Idiomarina piscisalsi]
MNARSYFSVSGYMKAQNSSVDLVSLTNALPGAVYQLELTESGDWHFHFVSEGIESIYGCTVSDLQKNTCVLKDIIVADDYEAVVNSLLESAKYQIPWNKEYRVVRNGELHWVYGHAVTERQANGSTLWKGQLLDITERKQLELTVKRHQRNLELAERVANLGHWKLNLNTGKSIWSDTVYELYGLEKNTTDPGLDIVMEKTHPQDRKAVTDAIEAAKKSGVRDVEHRIIRSDDTVRWLRESGIYQLDENGDEIIFGTVQDITDYKEMELKLRSTGGEDEHTGFYNRRMMLRALQRRFSFYKAHPEYPYFLLALKVTNDSKTLARAAEIVRANIRDYDTPGHLGNGLITVLLSTLSRPENNSSLRRVITELSDAGIESHCMLEEAKNTDSRFDDILTRALP